MGFDNDDVGGLVLIHDRVGERGVGEKGLLSGMLIIRKEFRIA